MTDRARASKPDNAALPSKFIICKRSRGNPASFSFLSQIVTENSAEPHKYGIFYLVKVNNKQNIEKAVFQAEF